MRRWLRCAMALGLLGLLLAFSHLALAASPRQEPQIFHIVSPGDTLFVLAKRYGTSVAAIVAANGLSDPDLIEVGEILCIPSSDGTGEERGTWLTHVVQPGETVSRLALRYGTSVAAIARANRLADPSWIRSGQRLLIPAPAPRLPALELGPITELRVWPPAPLQGQTLTIHLGASRPLTLTGSFDGRELHWVAEKAERGGLWRYWALAGVYALAEPGTHPLIVKALEAGGGEWTLQIFVVVRAGDFGVERILLPPTASKLLAPQLLRRERERLAVIWDQSAAQPMWSGRFVAPVRPFWPITSHFGERRTYNGGPVSGFHTGVDYGASEGALVLAPAAGRVVLAEPLTVRGNAVILDHGAGVHTGYWHLGQIFVKEGDEVAQGDPLGRVGNTGLSTGAHLHWEMRVGTVAVDPLQWIGQTMPPIKKMSRWAASSPPPNETPSLPGNSRS